MNNLTKTVVKSIYYVMLDRSCLILLLYKFIMRTMVDRKVESEAQIIMLDGTKPIGLAI